VPNVGRQRQIHRLRLGDEATVLLRLEPEGENPGSILVALHVLRCTTMSYMCQAFLASFPDTSLADLDPMRMRCRTAGGVWAAVVEDRGARQKGGFPTQRFGSET